ncbi:hypothetical protein COOONC_27174 [Cooperia oncophora]
MARHLNKLEEASLGRAGLDARRYEVDPNTVPHNQPPPCSAHMSFFSKVSGIRSLIRNHVSREPCCSSN